MDKVEDSSRNAELDLYFHTRVEFSADESMK
jgi:hypothetical protein